jgi:hypothetical protein
MKQKLFLLLLFTSGIQFSCSKLNNGCPDSGNVQKYFDVQGASINNYRITGTNSIGAFETTLTNNNENIDFDKLLVGIEFTKRYYSRSGGFSIGFGNTAYACDPAVPGYLGSEELIQSINITSNADFDPGHPAGQSLNDLFDYCLSNKPVSGLTSFVNTLPKKALERFQLHLKFKPSISTAHSFKLVYTQTNGETYTVSTPLIKLR